jgi:uncharacterized protein
MKPLARLTLVLACLFEVSSPAAAIETADHDILFSHGEVRLGGTVVSPSSPGIYPAMVLMPGSGPEARDELMQMARDFAGRGMVTLVYDKQGVGKSAGDWTRESADDLAGDALAAVELLRARPDVDRHRVGAWGISQSGWIVPRLAKRDPELAFAICVTGGGATPREVEMYGYDNKLVHNGFSETDRNAALSLVERYLQYLATGEGREELVKDIDDAKRQKWGPVLNLARVLPDAGDRDKWAWVATYDPVPDIQDMHMPVLVLLGGHDPFLPSGIAIQRWQAALAIAANAHNMVVSYPVAGHGVRINGHDTHVAPVYAPGYLAGQFAWLHTIGVLN